jgi:hypothetical protein
MRQKVARAEQRVNAGIATKMQTTEPTSYLAIKRHPGEQGNHRHAQPRTIWLDPVGQRALEGQG